MKFVIDRFEGQWAIIEGEDKEMYSISATALKGFKEGDTLVISKDAGESEKRAERIKNLADELFE